MQNIRSKGTKPEKLIISELRKKKIYFTCYPSNIFGKPDIVFKRKKIAIFIDSDFWHCNPKKFIMPKTNIDYWESKIKRNVQRDKEVNQFLKDKGWKILRFWVSDIKLDLKMVIDKILKSITLVEIINEKINKY